MLRPTQLSLLYHLNSCNIREIVSDYCVDHDSHPPRFRVYPSAELFTLPRVEFNQTMTFADVVDRRHSKRDFVPNSISLGELSSLLYLSYGIKTEKTIEGILTYQRTVPSAGGLYPIELYLSIQRCADLKDGIYHYCPRGHALELLEEGSFQTSIANLAIGQDMIRDASIVFIMTAIAGRTMWKYGERGYRYVLIDAGHIGQNLYLAATALGLGCVTIGGFFDMEVDQLLRLHSDEHSLYLACVGPTSEKL